MAGEYVRNPTTGLLTAWTGRNGTPESRRLLGTSRAKATGLITYDDTPDFADLYAADASGLLTPVRNLYGASDVVLDFSCGFFQAGGIRGNKPSDLANWTYTADGIIVPKVDGSLKTFATNVAPFTDYGFQPFETRQNLHPNNAFTGAVVGVVGAGGALPTGWVQGDGSATYTVLAVYQRRGLDVMRVRVQRNNGTGATVFPGVCYPVPAVASTQYTASFYYEEISFSNTDGANFPAVNIQSRNSGTYLSNFGGTTGALGRTTWGRNTRTAVSDATANQVWICHDCPLNASGVLDWTFEIAADQLEAAAFAGPPIRTTAGAVTRNAPTASELNSLGITTGDWTVAAEFIVPNVSPNPRVFWIDDGAGNAAVDMFVAASSTTMQVNINSANAGNLGTIVAGQMVKVAASRSGSNFQYSVNGAASGVATPTYGTVYSRLIAGNASAYNRPLDSGLLRLWLSPGVASSQSALNAITA